MAPAKLAEPEPLALTAEQILREDAAEMAGAVLDFSELIDDDEDDAPLSEAQLVDPEDIAFEVDDDLEEPANEERAFVLPVVEPPRAVVPPAPVAAPRVAPAPRPTPPSAPRAAQMPDPQLSSDMAEQLLEPTTDAAVKSNFAKLNGLSMANSGVTIDSLMREMLRPMLKDWLDENLPAVVERMVEKEIARISRGGE
jgi:cell pole-organizing protein PopZ